MNLKKYFLIAVSVFLIAAVLFLSAVFLRYRSWAADPKLSQKLTAYFSNITKSDFQYQTLGWRLLPFPAVRFSEPVFKFKTELNHEMKADSLELRLDLSQLILGQFRFSGLHLKEGVWHGQIDAPKGVHDFLVEHIDLKTSALRADRPVKMYMSGDTGGQRKAVVIHGELQLPPLEEPRLDNLGFEVQILTRNFRFEDSPEWEFLGWIPSSGPSDFLIELKHAPQSDRVDFSGNSGLHDLVFRSPLQPTKSAYKVGKLQVKFAGSFSPATDELKFTQCSSEFPFAQFNMQGSYLPHRREFRAMTFNFSNVKLDDLPTYFPEFKNKIPYFVGFSGMTDLSFSLSGLPNHLKIYGDFDLTKTLFTYGRFFQKPKEKPFHLKADLDWAAQFLSGEFSGSLEDLNFKGSLPEWRPSGAMKINFITNAFAAEKLPGFVPLAESYELGGNMKLFASFEGNLQSLEPFRKMFHLNLTDGKVLRKGTGAGFKDLNLELDFGALMMEAKASRFSIGGSFFEGTLKGLNPEKNPKWEGHLTSEKMVPADVWNGWKDFWGGENAAWLNGLHPWAQKMILSQDPFDALKIVFSVEDNHPQIHSLTARAFDGDLTGSILSQAQEQNRKIQIQATGNGMDAARLFKFLGTTQPGLEGRVNWKAGLTGQPSADQSAMNWTGPFALSAKDGFLNHFGLVQALEQMETLKNASSPGADRLSFKSLDVQGQVEDERLKVQDANLVNDQVQIQGEGELSGDGILNFRLKTRLESEYFRELFPKRAGDFISEGESFFGPVTILASGPMDGLNLKPDPQSVAALAGRYAKKKTESISKYL